MISFREVVQFEGGFTILSIAVFSAPCHCGVALDSTMTKFTSLICCIRYTRSMKLFKLQYMCNMAFSVLRCFTVIDWCSLLITLPPTQSIAAFEEGSFLPLPSREAVERSIGKGGNGTITIVYFKGVEFAVKRVSGGCSYMCVNG